MVSKDLQMLLKKINQKLSKNKFVNELDAWAVDVDYNSTIPVVEQINNKVVSAIKKIQGLVLNMMRLYGIEDISLFCGRIDSVDDICSIYQTMSKQNLIKLDTTQVTDYQMKINEEEMMRRLTNLALDFNAGNGTNTTTDCNESFDTTAIIQKIKQTSDKSNIEFLEVENFFKFVSNDFRKNNVGNMLHYMSESMNARFEKQRVEGSISSLQKVQSLQGRWFSVHKDNVEKIITGESVERNCIFVKNAKYYRVLSVFKKTYNKWRHERRGEKNEKNESTSTTIGKIPFGLSCT